MRLISLIFLLSSKRNFPNWIDKISGMKTIHLKIHRNSYLKLFKLIQYRNGANRLALSIHSASVFIIHWNACYSHKRWKVREMKFGAELQNIFYSVASRHSMWKLHFVLCFALTFFSVEKDLNEIYIWLKDQHSYRWKWNRTKPKVKLISNICRNKIHFERI